MLIEKEIIGPGTYWYTDQATGLPRKLEVTPDLCQHWYEQGSKMLSAGLTIPVPCEHDFDAHPMTPKDKLLNNAGWIAEYRLKDNKLFGVLDIQDPEIEKKLPKTIKWTSPWINSFTDGQGNKWDNVISHLALTTRPRITNQSPFPNVAAALSMASPVVAEPGKMVTGEKGFCLSYAGRLLTRKSDGAHKPKYPMAFSLFSGAALGEDDAPPKKKKEGGSDGGSSDSKSGGSDKSSGESKDSKSGGSNKPPVGEGGGGGDNEGDSEGFEDIGGGGDGAVDLPPMGSPAGDVSMEEILCDLLSALGVHCEKTGNDQMFKRSLYNAAMSKIYELTSKAQGTGSGMNNTPKPGGPGVGSGTPGAPNPLVQQEQQPMYMSLEDINKISDPTMRTIALSMYNENVKLRAEMDTAKKTTDSLRDAKLREAAAHRASRIALLSKVSPRVKADLEAMQTNAGFALSMGDGGMVVDPMEQTLTILEKGLGDMPRLLTIESSALSVQAQPTDGEMTAELSDKMADDFARMMGCPPEKKAS